MFVEIILIFLIMLLKNVVINSIGNYMSWIFDKFVLFYVLSGGNL